MNIGITVNGVKREKQSLLPVFILGSRGEALDELGEALCVVSIKGGLLVKELGGAVHERILGGQVLVQHLKSLSIL